MSSSEIWCNNAILEQLIQLKRRCYRVWLSETEPMQLSTDWSEGADHSKEKRTANCPRASLRQARQEWLSPSSPHQEHLLQAKPTSFQKPPACSIYIDKCRLICHILHTNTDLSSPHRSWSPVHSIAWGPLFFHTVLQAIPLKKTPR